MEDLKGKNWMAVPQFGGWDGKTGSETNYSVVFSQARANRKKHKNDFYRHSLGNERELLAKRHDDCPCEVRPKTFLGFLL
ncbi:hypothetical protein BUALT_Bualt13G0044400 [Buddleja alternifolia]|uniref:RIN4 pathogenic type III effector avirulence factor Avr cleavage site domain-containing protein n=1 Tax=Buddleja alternifolia TaxID=168488 RepID=A0AAV6WLH2_9LAMI|nr:hypothetical protein BUALT_Bualt13G0044400 [Buddleja alternifolia]